MMAPEPPADFVQRPDEFNALKRQLLDAKGDSVAAITAALRGAGGYGKTTLAKALAHDADIQDAYFDGILWAELGEKPERLIATLSDLVTLLSGERPQLETINAAAAKLGEALGRPPHSDGRRRRVAGAGPAAVPARRPELRPAGHDPDRQRPAGAGRAPGCRRDAGGRSAVSAVRRAAAGSGDARTREPCRPRRPARRMGASAQDRQWLSARSASRATSRCRSRSRARTSGSGPRVSPRSILAGRPSAARRWRSRSASVSTFCPRPNRSVSASSESFPRMRTFPSGVVARLWAATGGLADFETEDLLGRLFDLSLLLERDLGQGFFRLHDTVRQFLRDRAGKERLIAQHMALIASLDGAGEAADERELAATFTAVFRITLPRRASGKNWMRCCSIPAGSRRSSTRLAIFSDCSSTISNMALAKRRTSSDRTLRLISGHFRSRSVASCCRS